MKGPRSRPKGPQRTAEPTPDERLFLQRMATLRECNPDGYDTLEAYMTVAAELNAVGDPEASARFEIWIQDNPLDGTASRPLRELTLALTTGAWRDEVRPINRSRPATERAH